MTAKYSGLTQSHCLNVAGRWLTHPGVCLSVSTFHTYVYLLLFLFYFPSPAFSPSVVFPSSLSSNWSRDSSISIVTTVNWRTVVRFPARISDISDLHIAQLVCGTYTTSYPIYIYIEWNLPKPDPLYTGNLDKRKINFGTELFPM